MEEFDAISKDHGPPILPLRSGSASLLTLTSVATRRALAFLTRDFDHSELEDLHVSWTEEIMCNLKLEKHRFSLAGSSKDVPG